MFSLLGPNPTGDLALFDRTLKNVKEKLIKIGFMAYATLQHFSGPFKVGYFIYIFKIKIAQFDVKMLQ